jgi:hypothetical protein
MESNEIIAKPETKRHQEATGDWYPSRSNKSKVLSHSEEREPLSVYWVNIAICSISLTITISKNHSSGWLCRTGRPQDRTYSHHPCRTCSGTRPNATEENAGSTPLSPCTSWYRKWSIPRSRTLLSSILQHNYCRNCHEDLIHCVTKLQGLLEKDFC